jgi:hypothetical protein
MSPHFARVQRLPSEALLGQVAYLGRYAGQPFSEAIALPRGLRYALVKAVVAIVKEENGPQD